ncbi:MAG: prephenate dehydratase domain-containing protein [Myxococcota bacterium]
MTDPQEALKALRDRLDKVDRRFLEALAERQEIVSEVARLKSGGATVIRDASREEALLGRLVDLGRELGLDAHLVTRVFREVLDHSLRLQHERIAAAANPGSPQRTLRVGYQGGEGAFSHQCAMTHFAVRDAAIEYVGHGGFRPMLEALQDGDLDYAVLPIENTTAGSINESYDLLAEMDLHLVGEEAFRVEHCLIGFPDANLGDLQRIISHPVALAQCGRLLAELGCRAEAFEDTALAVAKVAVDGDATQAAIASATAAEIHGLTILRRGVQDQRSNFTRMVVVAREASQFDLRIPCKVSLMFATRHEEGALAKAVAVLAQHGLNLTKLESRPRPNAPWEYRFYLDFEGNLANTEVAAALSQLASHTSYLRVLGCYPTRTADAAQPAEPRRRPQVAPPVASVRRIGSLTLGDRPRIFAGPAKTTDTTGVGSRVRNAGGDALWIAHLDNRDDSLRKRWESTGEEAGLPIVLGVSRREDVREFARVADLLVVDGTGMHDRALLTEVGRTDRAVALTRAPHSSVHEWLESAETIRAAGNGQVILLDAGVQAHGRRAPDLSAIPELSRKFAVIVDVSDASDPVAMGRTAVSAGAVAVVLRRIDESLETLAGVLRAEAYRG